jgi:hypothetical protein
MSGKIGLFMVGAWAAFTAVSQAALPVISTQPVNQTNVVGTTATFSVAATGSMPLAYQWLFDGTAISGATNAVLTLSDVQVVNAGSYVVDISDPDGTTSSSVATLTVYSAPTSLFFDDFAGPTLNPMWQTNLPDAYCGSFPNGYASPALYLGAPNFAFQTLGDASVIRLTNTLAPLQRVGWNSASNFVTSDFRYEVRFNTLIQSPATSIDGFIEIWIIDPTDASRYDIISPFGGDYDGSPYFFVGSTIDSSFTQTRISYTNNTWYRLVLQGAPGQNIQAALLNDDGTQVATSTLAHGVGAYASGFEIALSQVIGGAGSPFPVDVAVDYAKVASGFAPAITSQPTNEIVADGGTASFSVYASGTAPLTYQWALNGAAITGATNSSLVITNVQADQSGLYSVEVINAYGAAFSSNATLNAGSAPVITAQPNSQTVAVNGNASFTVTAVGAAPLNYQWEYNGNDLAGATNATLSLTNVQYSQSGGYSVLIANTFGTLQSSNAFLTVQTPPFFTSQPASETLFIGATATFTATADGSQPLSFLWAFNGTNLLDATNDTLTLSGVQFSQAGVYTLTVSNAFGGVWSSNALLTVQGIPPVITDEPVSQTVTYGGSSSFSILAGGTGPLSYQWAFDGTNLAGATGATLALTDVQYGQSGTYSVTVSSPFGSVTSEAATLTVVSPLATEFFDDFSGTNLNPIWQTNLPDNAHSGSFPGYSQTATYLGAPNYTFQILNSNTVLRLTNELSPLTRRGWGSSTNFGGNNFFYEARFNTLNQSSTSSIDGFIEIWIMDAANSNRYDVVSPFGGNYDNGTYFFAGSSIDNNYVNPSFTYSSYTWYRLVLQSSPGNNIRASILNDAGAELIGYSFSHDASAFPSGFKIGISQTVGQSGAPFPVDVAVDYVRLTTTYPPFITAQPANEVVSIGAATTFDVGVTGLDPLAYQWSFNGTNIFGATNAVLTLTNIQLAEAGNYSVAITNTSGATNSAAATLTVVSPILITQQPVNATAASYGSASFSVSAAGNGPLTYQWQKNGTNLVDTGNLTGSTTTNLTIASVTLDDAGNYDVVISGPYDTTNSVVAVLVVPETIVSLGSTNAMSGGTIVVPVWADALGIENAIQASVGYDSTKLVLLSVTGDNLVPVYNDTNNGYVAFASLLGSTATLPAGSNLVAEITFQALPVTNTTIVNLTFGDTPENRWIIDTSLRQLPATYLPGTVVLSPAEYAADVYPRTNGDHQVNIFDWIEVGRMVAGLDVPTNSDEFARADCAPRNAPDGLLTVVDWVQAGRYALGLDPLTLVNPVGPDVVVSKVKPKGGQSGSRILQVGTVSAQRGQTVKVPIQLVCITNENAVGMTLVIPTNQFKFVKAITGVNASTASMNVNSNHAGKVGIALAMSPGTTLAPGTNQIAVLELATASSASGKLPITLDSSVVYLEVAGNTAASYSVTTLTGAVVFPSQPTLGATFKAGQLQFNWSLSTGTYQVQTADQPAGPWTTVTLPYTTNGDNVSCSLVSTNQQKFFRLLGN